MPLSQDYIAFFDLQQAGTDRVEQTRHDFVDGCAALLVRLGVAAERAGTIADHLYHHMADPSRHYHTPVHVLAMFAHAADVGVELSDAERLAVWFHDGVYEPAASAGDNESNSADWMSEVLADAGADAAVVAEADALIRATANNLAPDAPAAHHTIMDLDLAGMSVDAEAFHRQSLAVRAEATHLEDAEYRERTAAFFARLLERERLYRSPAFADREPIARRRIADEIERLTHANGRAG